jgi:hypothetical protein
MEPAKDTSALRLIWLYHIPPDKAALDHSRSGNMKIMGIARGDFEIQTVEARLKEAGLYSRYEGQIKDQQRALIMVSVRSVAEKERVKGIFENSGVTEIVYREEEFAAGN